MLSYMAAGSIFLDPLARRREMSFPIYQVDASTDRPFWGEQAAFAIVDGPMAEAMAIPKGELVGEGQ